MAMLVNSVMLVDNYLCFMRKDRTVTMRPDGGDGDDGRHDYMGVLGAAVSLWN